MIATYRVKFGGRLVPGYERERVCANLAQAEGLDQAVLDQWFSGGETVLAAGLSFDRAIELRERYAKQGALCELEAEHRAAAFTPTFESAADFADLPAPPAASAPDSSAVFFETPPPVARPDLRALRQPVAAPALWFVVTGGFYLFDWYYRAARELGQAAGRETLKLLIPGYNLVLLYRQLKRVRQRVGGFSPAAVLTWLAFWLTLGLILLLRYSRLWPVYFLAGLGFVRVQRAINSGEDRGRPAPALALVALSLLGLIVYGGQRLQTYNRTQLEAFSRLAPGRYGELRLAGDETLVVTARLVYLERAKDLMNDPLLTRDTRYRVLDEAIRQLEPYARPSAGADYYLLVDYLRQNNRFVALHRPARNRLNAAITGH